MKTDSVLPAAIRPFQLKHSSHHPYLVCAIRRSDCIKMHSTEMLPPPHRVRNSHHINATNDNYVDDWWWMNVCQHLFCIASCGSWNDRSDHQLTILRILWNGETTSNSTKTMQWQVVLNPISFAMEENYGCKRNTGSNFVALDCTNL